MNRLNKYILVLGVLVFFFISADKAPAQKITIDDNLKKHVFANRYRIFSNKNIHINRGYEILPDGTALQQLDPNASESDFETAESNNIKIVQQKAKSGGIHPQYRIFHPISGASLRPPSHAMAVSNALRLKSLYNTVQEGCSSPDVCLYSETPASIACVYGLVSASELAQEPGCNPNTATFNPVGGGGAIAVVLAYDNPTAMSDLNAFSSYFGLPTVNSTNFKVVYASGTKPVYDQGWSVESSLDTQWTHAMAPGAKIFLVEATDNNFTSLYNAVQVAAQLVSQNGGGIVSMSWGSSEFYGDTSSDVNFFPNKTYPGVVYVASTGDAGIGEYPGTSPFVVAAGGTAITRDNLANFYAEYSWEDGGNGISEFEARPSFQTGVAGIVGTGRGVPDISFDADPYSGVWIYNNATWLVIGGTSVSAPSLSGVLNSVFASNGYLGLASDNYTLKFIYNNSSNSTYFRDITQYDCGDYDTNYNLDSIGYDLCTGVGVPVGTGLLSGNLPLDGVCGSANESQLSTAPASGLCAFGTSSSLSGSGPWSWSCAGTNGGQTASCTTVSSPVTYGFCGTAYGQNSSSVPSTNMCQSGVSSTVAGNGPWYWTCQGTNAGTNSAPCSSLPLPINGTCGQASNALQSGPPTSGLCNSGYPSAIMNSTEGINFPYMWGCQGLYGGAGEQCVTFQSPNAACGSAAGISTCLSPTSGFCANGYSISGGVGNSLAAWGWTCVPNGSTIGAGASCSAPEPQTQESDVNCGPANGVATNTAPATGLCQGYYPLTASAVTGGNGSPWAWTCTAICGDIQWQASCSAPAVITSLSVPAGLIVSSVTATSVNLSWTASTDSAGVVAGYNVYRNGSNIGTTSAASYSDFGLSPSTTYTYTVSAYDQVGNTSKLSGSVSATTAVNTNPPLPPTGVTAVAGNETANQFVVIETGSGSLSSGTTSCIIKRSIIKGGPYTTIASIPCNNGVYGALYLDRPLSFNTTYYYVMSALGPGGVSANSAEASVTIKPALTAPSGLSAVSGNGTVALEWLPTSGASYYSIKRSTVNGGPYIYIMTDYALTYIDTVDNGTTYYYVITASNASNAESLNSAQVSATPMVPPLAPYGLNATAGNARVVLTWRATTGALSYNVGRSTVSGGPYTTITSSLTSPAYTDTSVSNGDIYYYVVSAVYSAGRQSANSAEVSSIPLVPLAAPVGFNVSVTNGQVVLKWTASKGATAYNVKKSFVGGGPYTTIANLTNNTYTDTSVSFNTTYYYVVSAINVDVESPNSAQASIMAPPEVPSFWINAVGNAQVQLEWFSITGATSFNIKRSTVSGGPYTTIGNLANTNGTFITYTDTTVSNGTTYYYVVTSVNAGGESANSSQLSATPVPLPPSAPVGITAAAGNAQIVLTWAASTGAASYIVERGTTSGGPYSTTFPVSGGSSTSYKDTSVINSTTYYYVVVAVNAGGNSPASVQVSATPVLPPSPPPTLTAVAGVGQVSLTWGIRNGATSYIVKRSTISGGPYSITFPVSGTSSISYTDTSVINGTTYYYVVVAVNAGGNSGPSPQASATPDALPSVPTNLAVTAYGAPHMQTALSWTASTDDVAVTGYKIYRNGTLYNTIIIPAGDVTSYNDQGVVPSTTYTYAVSAYDAIGNNSAQSTSVSVTTPADTTPPSVPTNLAGTAVSTSQINLTWTASSDIVLSASIGYKVYRNGVLVGTSTAPSYSDTGLTASTKYTYTVSAYDPWGNISAQSASASVTTLADTTPPSVPTNLAGTTRTNPMVVNLTWTASTDNVGVTGYKIYRNGIFEGTNGPSLIGGWDDSSVFPSTTYTYTVAAVDAAGNNSAQSASISVTTPADTIPPSVPTNLAGTAVSTSQINLTWTASSDNVISTGVAGYKVYRNGVLVGTSNIIPPSYSDKGLSAATTYTYTVSAYDASGNSSAQSTSVSVTTN